MKVLEDPQPGARRRFADYGLDSRIIEPTVANTNSGAGMVSRRERIEGLLSYFNGEPA